jgi:hypothetical protein
MEVAAVDASSSVEGVCANEVGPRSEDGVGGTILAHRSLDATGPRAVEFGLLGYPNTPSPFASWRRGEDDEELACSQIVAACQLLLGVMATVGRDILHLVRVSPKEINCFT